jgi:hypothetical protein
MMLNGNRQFSEERCDDYVSKYEFDMESRENFYRYPYRYRVQSFRIYGNLY